MVCLYLALPPATSKYSSSINMAALQHRHLMHTRHCGLHHNLDHVKPLPSCEAPNLQGGYFHTHNIDNVISNIDTVTHSFIRQGYPR